MTTTNKPMTGEQLDELMTVAVNMQRDSEKVGERPAAMFAYAVQVAVLELRKVRDDAAALASLEAEAAEEWTNEQCLEFLSIAFRHAEIKGDLEFDDIRQGVKVVNGSRAAMLQGAEPVTTACKLPMQPLAIDVHGTLRFKENPIVRKLLDYATEHGYGLNEIALDEFEAEYQMQLAQLIGYSLSGYGTLSYVTDESYERAAAAAPQQEAE
ncbi:hypothetical protein [Leclercia sp. UBA1284]|uniref:hypothetical protein n=1 Tax=Leclercia sp. UBA1284 TaxID=1946737 RepID=UPI0025807C22|nr:hypothetical protein [Leclercia sp. UBA1284]